MPPILLCPICRNSVKGSSYIDPFNSSQIAGFYVIHMIDEHWDLVEQIRATRVDVAAREQLADSLEQQLASHGRDS